MRISEKELRKSLQEGLVRHHVPGVSVAILSEGEITTAAAGVTNVDTGVEVTPDTIMHIGSITKVLNATLVMQLVDEGHVDLDERIVRYLPDLAIRDREALEQITVKMLLNHTSGVDGTLLPDQGHDEETIEKAVARFAQLEQVHRPGAEFSYCNPGTVIAGYLAQRLTRTSWYRLIRERIFERLDMQNAAALPEEALLHRTSIGHYLKLGSNVVRTSAAFLPLSFAPAGSTLMMSARDLIAFARAHMVQGLGANGARLLSASSTRAMQEMTVNNKDKGYTFADGMGIGWMVYDDGLLTHAGGGTGIASVIYVHPERQFAAAVLTNADYSFSLGLINELVEPLLREVGNKNPLGMAEIRLPAQPVKIDPRKYVGVYEHLAYRYRVLRTADRLALTRQGKFRFSDGVSTEESPPTRLIPLGNDKFVLESDDEERSRSSDAFRIVTFRNPDADGCMRHLGNGGRLYPRVS